MNVLGCDLGALATKTVIISDNALIAYDITPNRGRLGEAVEHSLNSVLSQAKMSLSDMQWCGGTGWGQKYITFPHVPQTSITCLARGAQWARAGARTVIDIGGLSTTIVNVNSQGKVLEYRTNDRCASGTGFYLEIAAQALELSIEEMGQVALSATGRAFISGQCAVFGESEIVTHINDGSSVPDIAAGISYSIASGVGTMARRLGVESELVVCGGVAKHEGVTASLLEILEMEAAELEVDPQILSALGAALGNGKHAGEKAVAK